MRGPWTAERDSLAIDAVERHAVVDPNTKKFSSFGLIDGLTSEYGLGLPE